MSTEQIDPGPVWEQWADNDIADVIVADDLIGMVRATRWWKRHEHIAAVEEPMQRMALAARATDMAVAWEAFVEAAARYPGLDIAPVPKEYLPQNEHPDDRAARERRMRDRLRLDQGTW